MDWKSLLVSSLLVLLTLQGGFALERGLLRDGERATHGATEVTLEFVSDDGRAQFRIDGETVTLREKERARVGTTTLIAREILSSRSGGVVQYWVSAPPETTLEALHDERAAPARVVIVTDEPAASSFPAVFFTQGQQRFLAFIARGATRAGNRQ